MQACKGLFVNFIRVFAILLQRTCSFFYDMTKKRHRRAEICPSPGRRVQKRRLRPLPSGDDKPGGRCPLFEAVSCSERGPLRSIGAPGGSDRPGRARRRYRINKTPPTGASGGGRKTGGPVFFWLQGNYSVTPGVGVVVSLPYSQTMLARQLPSQPLRRP